MPVHLEFSEEWLRDYQRRTGCKAHDPGGRRAPTPSPSEAEAAPKKPPKYRNQKTTVDGILFDSRHEADRYNQLKILRSAGEVTGFACQVPFYLPGGIVYRADFVVLYPDGRYVVEDAKSPATRKDKVYRLKRRLMKTAHGIDIVEV